MLNLLGLPEAASSHAGEIDEMIVLLHWVMVALFVPWAVYFAIVLVRFRRAANPRASYEGAHGTVSKGLEIAVVIAEAVLLVGFAIPAWAKRVSQFPPENEAVVIRVVAEQFAWNIQYAGPDGKFGRTDITKIGPSNPLGLDPADPDGKDDVTSINIMAVPEGRPVLIHLGTKDVIHSFGLYEMRVKQDAIPGMDIPVWFIPTVTTDEMRRRLGKADFEYEINCSQLCGLGHYRMRGVIHVQSDADFRRWLADPNRG